MLTDNPLFRKSKFIKNHEEVANRNQIIRAISKKNIDCYNFIIVGDDKMLKGILDSDFPLEKKIKILPVTGVEYLEHIFSKIGLSKMLSKSNILTPEFLVARNFFEATEAAKKVSIQ